RRHIPAVGDVPTAIIEVIRGQSEPMTACSVVSRVVSAESWHRCLERWPADHPGPMVDDAPVATLTRDIRHALALFLAQRPAAEHLPAPCRRQSPLPKTVAGTGP